MGLFVGLLAGAFTISMIIVPAPEPASDEVAEGPQPAPSPVASLGWKTAEPENGRGMLVGGALLSGVGLPTLITGLVILKPGRTLEGDAIYVAQIWGGSFIGAGLLSLAVGVPLLVVGVRRHKEWQLWQRENRISLRPHLERGTRGTWALGLQLRF